MEMQTALSIGFPPILGWMAFTALILSAVGFFKFIYFISIGYGLSVAGIALLLFFHGRGQLPLIPAMLLVLLAVYGLRLAGYLLIREVRSASYRKTLERETKQEKPIPLPIRVLIWLSVSLLYVAQTAPAAYLLEQFTRSPQPDAGTLSILGVVMAATGLLLEGLADWQKSAAKKRNPDRWVDTGLFAWVRCPNYLGEVLLWLGVYLCGMPAYASGWAWMVSTAGFLLIVYVMLSGARRLERGQDNRYGDQPAYLAYTAATPILLPLVPWYSMKKWSFIRDV